MPVTGATQHSLSTTEKTVAESEQSSVTPLRPLAGRHSTPVPVLLPISWTQLGSALPGVTVSHCLQCLLCLVQGGECGELRLAEVSPDQEECSEKAAAAEILSS